MKPKCDLCGTRHESYQAHVFASNTASNRTASNAHGRNGSRVGEPKEAINKCGSRSQEEVPESLGERGSIAGSVGEGGGPVIHLRGFGRGSKDSKQRWSREAYNSYQREYMRKRRGLAKDST
jgi:hypothetical protein